MIIDPSGRGPTMRQLMVAGVAGLIVFALIMGFLMARYRGYFVPKVNVVAQLTTTGDGLPAKADVKFRGVLVGAVKDVDVAARGETQNVRIEMKPDLAKGVPSNVTARVVPSNLFAVTSVELVFNGPSDQFLREGAVIEEDRSQGTIALQDTLTSVEKVLDKIDPVQFGRVLGTLSQALDGSGRMPGSTVERLDRWLLSVDQSIPDLGVMLGDFAGSLHALNQSAPELLDVVNSSVQTARTIADRRAQLVELITGTSSTVDKVNDLFARNPDVGKQLTAGTSDTFGALAADPQSVTQAIVNLGNSTAKLNTVFTWGPQKQMVWNLGLTFTPYKPWTAADCPRYDELAGPSCATAPAEAILPPLPENLKPRRLDSSIGLPALLPIPGLPMIPGLTTEGAPAPTAQDPTKPFAGTPLEGLFPWLPGLLGGEPAPAAPAAPAEQPEVKPAAAPISYQGEDAMTQLLGRKPTASEVLLLSTIMRNGTLQVTPSGGSR
ncbi:MCE family protein [Nocardia sp. XZ_19_385]|uniref:MCE family protein n=1 Tax=Nocardia sp. XZ_19_385 TaxID=2769488 RepID=UPI00188F6552|nr:MCE family protein [Nocardia sp. XZ_19_385]